MEMSLERYYLTKLAVEDQIVVIHLWYGIQFKHVETVEGCSGYLACILLLKSRTSCELLSRQLCLNGHQL